MKFLNGRGEPTAISLSRKVLRSSLQSLHMHIVINTDGGSRGNPGPAAASFTVKNNQAEILHEDSAYLGVATNNVAEYSALRMAMLWVQTDAKRLGITKLDIVMDSELVVKQMRGEYKIKDANLQLIASEIKTIEKSLNFPVSYIHVKRAENKRADLLVNEALDAKL